MFKKTKIAAATMALMSVAAVQNVSAVALDELGSKSEVLIFPYYNTNNGFTTSFAIRNTTADYKVLKMRFRESGISNDVLDFNVYMSPQDHFSVTVAKNAAGDAVLTTSDTTCTLPAIPVAGVTLNYGVYTNTSQADTREGYLEVIEQGIVVDGDVSGDGKNDIHKAIKHVQQNDGSYKPGNCGLIATAWSNGYFTQGGAKADPAFAAANPNKTEGGFYSDEATGSDGLPNNMLAPNGGLQGYSILLDIPKGAAFVADAIGIRNYSTTVAQHYKSDDQTFYLLPSLASGSELTSTVTNDAATGTVTNTWGVVAADWGLSDLGVAPNISVPSGVNPMPMADVLSATQLTNDYFINPDFDGATDWVVTLPMRKHGIYNGFRYDGIAKNGSAHPVDKFIALSSTDDVDVTMASKFYNREEAEPAPGSAGFSPAVQAGKSALTREVNVLSFTNTDNATNKVLGSDSPFTFTLESGFIEGWATLNFSNYNLFANHTVNAAWTTLTSYNSVMDQPVLGVFPGTATATLKGTASMGVPAVGFAAIRGNLGASSTVNLGETIPHSLTRKR